MTWSIFDTHSWTHVVPDEDLKIHTLSAGCWCRPTEENLIFVHHSMDRREDFEHGKRKLS